MWLVRSTNRKQKQNNTSSCNRAGVILRTSECLSQSIAEVNLPKTITLLIVFLDIKMHVGI
jgi:hypothetical protein